VRVWKIASQEKILEYFVQPDESLNSLVFSDDFMYLAVVSGTHSVLITEIANGQTVKNFDNSENFPNAKISYVSFIPGNYVAYSFNHGPILIAPVKSSVAPTQINAWAQYFGLGYTQRGELITSWGDITVYKDIKKKLGISSVPSSEHIHQKVRNDLFLASNSSVPYYTTTGDNGIIHIRMGTTDISQVAFPMGKPVNLMLGSNGNLIFQNSEGKVYCWIPTVSEFKRFSDSDDAVYEFRLPRWLDNEGKKLQIKDTRSERVVFSLDMRVPAGITPAATISQNGKHLAVSEDSESVDIYDVENGRKSFHVKLNADSDDPQIFRLELSKDSSKIAVARANSIIVISPQSNKVLGKIEFPLPFSDHFFFDGLSFSPRDTFLVVQTENAINLFDASNCKLRHSIPFKVGECYPKDSNCSWLALSPDETFVALTSRNEGLVQIWNLGVTRHLVDIIKTGTRSPELAVGAAFTSDSRYFVWSSGNSGRIHSYDLLYNKQLPDFPIDEGIESLFITKTNQLFVNGSKDYYLTDSSNFISLLTGKPSDINSKIVTKTGFRIASSEAGLYSQEQLDLLLSNNRPSNQLFAVDRNGSDIESFGMFGGVQLRRPPIRLPNSLPSRSNGSKHPATNVSSTTRDSLNRKPGESRPIVCPTGFYMPVFNPFPITFDNENTPFCSDFPMLDVAEDTAEPRFSQSIKEYLSTRRFKGAKGLVVVLYMDNGAYSKPTSYVAKNVKIATTIERDGNVYKLTATYTGDNVAPLSASVFIQVDADERLEVIPNSGYMYTYVGHPILDRQNFNLARIIHEGLGSEQGQSI
jgi:WD40 repeat protein